VRPMFDMRRREFITLLGRPTLLARADEVIE
jgi:hypothetical protein